ncbi:MAG: DUF2284 domain-containing protein [Clostridiales bacterium]|nr:DUF2284 domain-containing protein [Clostridiales bacterium]
MKNKIDRIITELYALGANKVSVIDAMDVVTNVSFRDMCKSNACGMYGKCWTCPPDCGDINQLIKSLGKYSKVLVFQTVGKLEDSYDFEGMTEHKKQFLQLVLKVKKMFISDNTEALVLGAGGCGICERCSKRDNELCRFPDLAIYSLEAYGIDVYALSKSADMKYINGQNTVTYFSAVFFN